MDISDSASENSWPRERIEELQQIEAEWVTRELEEFVKLIQRYRSLYLSAVFLAIGWVLSQAVATTTNAAPVPPLSLDALRLRPDIAAVLCVIPFVNTLFGLLMLEASAQIQTLARYRFLLGFELGGGQPAWRWECWKSSSHGSIRAWTNPLNMLFTVSTVGLTISVLWFSYPAIPGSKALALLWWSGLFVNTIVAFIVGTVAYKLRRQNFVAAKPKVTWADLWPQS
jgi:hypothetical protein